MRVERTLDGLADPTERDAALEKGGNRHLIGRVEDSWSRAAGASRRNAANERRKNICSHRLERQGTGGNRVEPPHA
jgi:hypothetical protein